MSKSVELTREYFKTLNINLNRSCFYNGRNPFERMIWLNSDRIIGTNENGGSMEGIACQFFKVPRQSGSRLTGSHIGIKTYASPIEAIETRSWQAEGARRGIAPKVGRLLMVCLSDAVLDNPGGSGWSYENDFGCCLTEKFCREVETRYGYESELAISVPNRDDQTYQNQYDGVMDRAVRMGMKHDDLRVEDNRNFGFVVRNRKRKLVIVDWGMESHWDLNTVRC